jgi:hypothetical protein
LIAVSENEKSGEAVRDTAAGDYSLEVAVNSLEITAVRCRSGVVRGKMKFVCVEV